MTVKPLDDGLSLMRKNCANYINLTRTFQSTRTRQRALSVMYYFSDEEMSATNTWYTPAISWALNENVVLGHEMRLKFQPLIVESYSKVTQAFYNLRGPSPQLAMTELESALKWTFDDCRLQVVTGFKPGFFGGPKPVMERITLPIVDGIECVLN